MFTKLVSKLDSLDSGSINSYVHLLAREHGFMESKFNSIREGIIIDDSYHLAYHNSIVPGIGSVDSSSGRRSPGHPLFF